MAIITPEVLDQIGGTVKARMILSGNPRTSCTRESRAKAPLGEQYLAQKDAYTHASKVTKDLHITTT